MNNFRPYQLNENTNRKNQHPYTLPVTYTNFSGVSCYGHDIQLDYWKVYDNNDELLYYEEFTSSGNQPMVSIDPVPPCDTLFMQYVNQYLGTNYSFAEIKCLYRNECNINVSPCEDTMIRICSIQ